MEIGLTSKGSSEKERGPTLDQLMDLINIPP